MKKILLTIIVVLYIGLMFVFSVISSDQLGGVYRDIGISGDNIIHVAAFFLFALLLRLALSSYKVKRSLLFVVIGAILAAVVIEVIQCFIPTRHPMMLDFGLHAIGVLCYAALDFVFFSKRKI